jgi:hypothetical protein
MLVNTTKQGKALLLGIMVAAQIMVGPASYAKTADNFLVYHTLLTTLTQLTECMPDVVSLIESTNHKPEIVRKKAANFEILGSICSIPVLYANEIVHLNEDNTISLDQNDGPK